MTGDVMKYKEKLLWILDKIDQKSDGNEYQENIDFVHSLGKKCDCVGWSELDMDEPDAHDVLDRIQTFCKERGYRARGWYERVYTDVESDWYEIKSEPFRDDTVVDIITVKTQNGDDLYLNVINAYRELNVAPKGFRKVCVPDRFRKACIENGITDVEFCWVKDKGRYEAEQYFYIYPERYIPRIIYDRSIRQNQTERLQILGGKLPEIASVFYNLEHIQLQDCFLKEDMPSDGIAYVYCPSAYDFCGRYKILIHKNTAEILIKAKALSSADIVPVCVVEKCPEGYDFDMTEREAMPFTGYIKKSFSEYEGLKAKGRPEYNVKDKEALSFFRKTKNERKADFSKGLSKKYADKITDSFYKTLLPYYGVSNGGQLSDEYMFLSYSESLKATDTFFESLEKEELLTEVPCGAVIVNCADGDSVLITETESIIRWSHEAPEIVCEWQSIAKFFVDALNDS